MILIVNFHGQYVHRIWRSLKYLKIESEIVPNMITADEVLAKKPSGVIFSGGPYSVYKDKEKLGSHKEIIKLDLPVLGICLGHQMIADSLGGEVKEGLSGEYAAVEIDILDEDDLFIGLGSRIVVWESHKDEVASMPKDFKCLASSSICKYEAIKHKSKPIYGVQFHPEVEHTPKGPEILKNFHNTCKK